MKKIQKFKLMQNDIKHMPCNGYGYWVAEHLLFNLNTQKTASNNEWKIAA